MLYFDCFSGASGDMILGALIDAGADFERIRSGLDTLGLSGYAASAEKVAKKGILATRFLVSLDPSVNQPHRGLHEVLEVIRRGELPESVKSASAQTFRRLAEAEAQVHGVTVDKVHFHEVGAVDSILDIVGVHLALHELAAESICASLLPLGSGTVRCAHGVLPVPAPATALLLKGALCYGGDADGELVTPTGAALITQLVQRFGPMPSMILHRIGYGCGTRDFSDRANVLRVLIGSTGETAPSDAVTEPISVIEANIDDMNPELLPSLIADALQHGARDAFLTPILGKKGRPAHLVTVLCDESNVTDIAAVVFRGSTTLGVRIRREERICLARRWKVVETPWGKVRLKIGLLAGRPHTMAPEFEDCRTLAERGGVSVRAVYEAAVAAVAKGETKDE